jgi:hypothetical protein
MAAAACPEGKENRSGSRSAAYIPLRIGRGRPTVRLISCTARCEATSVASATREASCHSQQRYHGAAAAATLGPVPPR